MVTVPAYDFDINTKDTYLYLWILRYMNLIADTVKKSGISTKNKSLLDIGIGRGRVMALYKHWNIKKIIGLDIDKNDAILAKKQAARLGMRFTSIIDNANNQKLKQIPDESFDIISVINTLHMVNKNTKKTIITELKRILKPGGTLIIMNLHKPSLFWLATILTRRQNQEFISDKKLLSLLQPLNIVATSQTNYFYIINSLYDHIRIIFGQGISERFVILMENLCRTLHIPGSATVFIFTRQSGILHSP